MIDRIQTLFEAYVSNHNFSGAGLIKQGDTTLLEFASGYAHRGYQVFNTADTKFDIASPWRVSDGLHTVSELIPKTLRNRPVPKQERLRQIQL